MCCACVCTCEGQRTSVRTQFSLRYHLGPVDQTPGGLVGKYLYLLTLAPYGCPAETMVVASVQCLEQALPGAVMYCADDEIVSSCAKSSVTVTPAPPHLSFPSSSFLSQELVLR